MSMESMVIRKLDGHCRVVIPQNIRCQLGLEEGSKVDLRLFESNVVVSAHRPNETIPENSSVAAVDNLGRIIIPEELFKAAGLQAEMAVSMSTNGEYIFIRQYERTCSFCESKANVMCFKGGHICEACRNEIKTQP